MIYQFCCFYYIAHTHHQHFPHVRGSEKAVALYSCFPVFLNHTRIHEKLSHCMAHSCYMHFFLIRCGFKNLFLRRSEGGFRLLVGCFQSPFLFNIIIEFEMSAHMLVARVSQTPKCEDLNNDLCISEYRLKKINRI